MAIERIKSVSREIQRLLSEFIREEMKDPRANLLMSVTNVEVTKDLRSAKVYISFMQGTFEEQFAAIGALQKASAFFHRRLTQEMTIKRIPLLRFYNDHSIEHGVEICKLLDTVKKQDEEALGIMGETSAEDNDD